MIISVPLEFESHPSLSYQSLLSECVAMSGKIMPSFTYYNVTSRNRHVRKDSVISREKGGFTCLFSLKTLLDVLTLFLNYYLHAQTKHCLWKDVWKE